MMADKTITFEEAIRKLDELVQKLESGKLSLEESVAHYEEGMRLAILCEQTLQSVEQKIESLSVENGQAVRRPIAPLEGSDGREEE
jgi:exodeoxyribonuclease VII small subunit